MISSVYQASILGASFVIMAEHVQKKITKIKSKMFSLERLWSLKQDFCLFSLKDRVKCGGEF